jgi:hypothetical protein
MQGAIERSVNVNAMPDSTSGGAPSRDEQGPCLYFGPRGQRCDRRALENGYCSRHQTGAQEEFLRTHVPRRVVAVLGLLAVMWPLLADLIREILRFLR